MGDNVRGDRATELLEHISALFTKEEVIAMLTELQLEIEEQKFDNHIDKDTWNSAISVCSEVIQEKINALKGETK